LYSRNPDPRIGKASSRGNKRGFARSFDFTWQTEHPGAAAKAADRMAKTCHHSQFFRDDKAGDRYGNG
jgi:hypothetical protein